MSRFWVPAVLAGNKLRLVTCGGVLMLKKSKICHSGVKWTPDTEDWQILAISIHWLQSLLWCFVSFSENKICVRFYNTQYKKKQMQIGTKIQFAAQTWWSWPRCSFSLLLWGIVLYNQQLICIFSRCFSSPLFLWAYSELQEGLVHLNYIKLKHSKLFEEGNKQILEKLWHKIQVKIGSCIKKWQS